MKEEEIKPSDDGKFQKAASLTKIETVLAHDADGKVIGRRVITTKFYKLKP